MDAHLQSIMDKAKGASAQVTMPETSTSQVRITICLICQAEAKDLLPCANGHTPDQELAWADERKL